MFQPLHYTYTTVLKSVGFNKAFLWFTILHRSLTILAIIITYRFGITGIIYGQIAVQFFMFSLLSYFISKNTYYSLKHQLSDWVPSLIVAVLMASAIYGAGLIPFSNGILSLALQILLGAGFYITLSKIWKTPGIQEVEEIALQGLRFFRNRASQMFLKP
ncbi:MAG: polysaccharide biosynthesis C-terminal domain-containing protein, partial [bacterium]